MVTYYPAFEDNSAMATATRFITTIILFIMLMAMIISVDGFTMVILIMFKYKLITLRNYFDKLRKDTEILHQSSDPQLAVNHLVNGLIKGIIMHKELLRL